MMVILWIAAGIVIFSLGFALAAILAAGKEGNRHVRSKNQPGMFLLEEYEDGCLKKMNTLAVHILEENKRQLAQWGVQRHTVFEWLAYATEEHGELSEAISEYVYRCGPPEHIVSEAIQAATLHLKIAEMFLPNKERRIRNVYRN